MIYEELSRDYPSAYNLLKTKHSVIRSTFKYLQYIIIIKSELSANFFCFYSNYNVTYCSQFLICQSPCLHVFMQHIFTFSSTALLCRGSYEIQFSSVILRLCGRCTRNYCKNSLVMMNALQSKNCQHAVSHLIRLCSQQYILQQSRTDEVLEMNSVIKDKDTKRIENSH